MKVTAIIPDPIVEEVRHRTGGKHLTDALIIALKDWLSLQAIRDLNNQIEKKPLRFKKAFSAQTVRELNRHS